MILSDFLKLQEIVKAYRPNPVFVKLGKTMLKAHRLSDTFLKPSPLSELGKLVKKMEPYIIIGNNNDGMSIKLTEFKDILDGIKNKSEFLEYNVDLLNIKPEGSNIKETEIKIDESKKLKKIIGDIYRDQSNLLQLNPREFEEVIAELLFSQGFEVELTKRTRDNGYDILALKDLKSQTPIKFIVECKRFIKQKVGVEIVRSFKEVILTEKANRGIIVTTSYFTADAKRKQKDTPYLLDYRDKDKVLEWVNEYYISQISS